MGRYKPGVEGQVALMVPAGSDGLSSSFFSFFLTTPLKRVREDNKDNKVLMDPKGDRGLEVVGVCEGSLVLQSHLVSPALQDPEVCLVSQVPECQLPSSKGPCALLPSPVRCPGEF